MHLVLRGNNAVVVFQGDSTKSYSQESSGIYSYSLTRDYYVAARKITNGKSSIVVKREYDNWMTEYTAADSGNVDSPEIQYDVLTYNNDLEGKKNIYLLQDITKPSSFSKFITNPKYDYFNFKTDMTLILTGATSYYQFFPYAYQVLKNDSLFTRVSLNEYYPYDPDTLVYTRIKDSKLLMGNMGYSHNNHNFYAFWEDSIGGKIQILGRKSFVTIGGVSDKFPVKEYVLEQNYPNPFNPTTTIRYSLPFASNVRLSVYNLLGQEINLLENSYKQAGKYMISFNASDHPSGIYFYKLEAGGYNQFRKMVLIK